MHTDLMVQQIHAAHLDSQRRNNLLRNEQIRIARMTRPSFMTLISRQIGTILISAGERLRQERTIHSTAQLERMNSAHTA